MSVCRLGKMVINIRAPRRGTFLIISSSVHGCETWPLTKKKTLKIFCNWVLERLIVTTRAEVTGRSRLKN